MAWVLCVKSLYLFLLVPDNFRLRYVCFAGPPPDDESLEALLSVATRTAAYGSLRRSSEDLSSLPINDARRFSQLNNPLKFVLLPSAETTRAESSSSSSSIPLKPGMPSVTLLIEVSHLFCFSLSKACSDVQPQSF